MEWMKDAACKNMDTRIFFPEKRGEKTVRAKKICESCPVINECLEFAMSWGEDLQGVWGGLNQKERTRILRRKKNNGEYVNVSIRAK